MRKIKKLMVILFVFASVTCYAQHGKNNLAKEYSRYVDSLFAIVGVTKNHIPSGILYDRAISLAKLQDFKETDTINNNYFFQAVLELRNAAYDSNLISSTDYIRTITDDYIYRQNIIPIGIMNYRFNYIDTLAKMKGMVDINSKGKIKLHKDIVKNGLKEQEVFMAGFFTDGQEVKAQTRFVLAPELIMKNTRNEIQNVEIDFDDGLGFQIIVVDEPIDVSYSKGGKKNIKLKITSDNDPPKIIKSSYIVSESSYIDWGLYKKNYLRQRPIYAKIPYNGFSGLGWLTYIYRNTDQKLRKTLLIVDGFDPGNSSIDERLFNEYLNNPESVEFANLLYENGYDIVILDFPKAYNNSANKIVDGGADYIQRNAFITVRAIQMLDSILKSNGSNEKLIVVGPSMGGLVTRYALAYMEKSGLSHNTRLWVSFDSPQNGANIPIGAQHFIKFLSSISDAADDALREKLNSAAARQMVIHHYLSNSETPKGDPNYNPAWNTDLGNIGYPQNLRKIAISNGSLNSTPTGNPGSRAVTMDIVFLGFTVGWGYINTTLGYDERKMVFKGILPDEFSTTSKYAKGSIGSFSLDNSPGGTRTTFKDLKASGDWYYSVDWDIPIETHAFIPTKSALAFTGSNKDLAENITGRNLINTGETPFQSYFGSINKNMAHISFSAELALWLINEINGIPQPPMQEEYKLTGPDLICSSSPVTYNFSSTPSLATVKWSCSDNLIILSNGSNYCSISPLAPVNSYQAWLQADIMVNSVRVGTFKKVIRLSYIPTPPIINVPSEPINCNFDAIIGASANPSDVSYSWNISNGTILSQNGAELLVRANCPPEGWRRPWKMTLYVQAINSCGSSSGTRDISVTSDGLVNPTVIIITPNPSADDITISEKVDEGINDLWTLRLINSKGMIVLFKTESLPKTINIRNLSPGIYFLVAKRGSYSEQQTIIIK